MITFITQAEAQERANESLIVYAFPYEDDDEEYEEVDITGKVLLSEEYGDEVRFGYNKEAEEEAEEIFNNLRSEVKKYLHHLLLVSENPLFTYK